MTVRLRGWRTGRFRIQEGNRDPNGFVEPVEPVFPPAPLDLDPSPLSVPFVDPMTRVSRKLQTVPAYEYDNSLVNALYTENNQLSCQTNDAQGAVYKSPNMGINNLYVKFLAVGSHANGPLVCVRFQDADNFIGIRRVGANAVVIKAVNGVETTVFDGNLSLTAESVVTLTVVDDDFEVKSGFFTEFGSISGPTLTSTRQGFLARGAFLAPWIDDYEAGTASIINGPGPDPVAAAVPFVDNFNRGNRTLESTTAWTHDGFSAGALASGANTMIQTAGVTGPAAYKSPDIAKLNQYVKFVAKGDAGATGPYVCCRLGDRTHFVGVKRNGVNAVVVANDGTGVTTLYNAAHSLSATSVIELRVTYKYTFLGISDWSLRIDNVQVASGPLDITVTSTRHGVIAQGPQINPFIDDYEAGFLTDPVADTFPNTGAVPFIDTFVRDNRTLESIPGWTHDGLIASAAKTVREKLVTSTNAAAGSTYKSPDLALGHNYVKFTYSGPSSTSLVCTRMSDNLNWMGIRHTGTNLQLIKSVAGVETTLSNNAVTAVSGDTFQLNVNYMWGDHVDTPWALFKNGTQIFTGTTTSPSPDSTRQGILARGAASSPFITGYESGTLGPPPFAPDVDPENVADPFVDNFNRVNRTLDGIPAWTHDGQIANAARTANSVESLGPPSVFLNNLTADTTNSSGSAYQSPDTGSSNHYVQFVGTGLVSANTRPVVAVRLADRLNWIGVRRGATVAVLSNVGGTVATLSATNSPTATDVIRLEVSGLEWFVKLNGAQIATGLIPSSQSASTRTGIVPRGAVVDPWIDNFESGTVAAPVAGSDPPSVFAPFNDKFTRGTRSLESATPWTSDGSAVNGMVTYLNQLVAHSTTLSLYTPMDTGNTIHCVQANFIGSTLGPAVVVRASDKNNWLGMSRTSTNIAILQNIAGTVSTLSTVTATAAATSDFRLVANANTWTLFKDGTSIGTGTISTSLSTFTKVGVVSRTALNNPWIDNFWAARGNYISFKDDFNRANENLESNANWTRVDGSSGYATVATNALSCATTATDGALFVCPDVGTANHYVQFIAQGASTSTAGPVAIVRGGTRNNWLGIHRSSTNVRILENVGGTKTALAILTVTTADTDVLRLEANGTTWKAFQNGVEIGTGTFSASLTSTRCGVVPRGATQSPWLDDFQSGAL